MRIKNQKGNTAIEFAIVFPLLIVLIFGIIEFSLILYDKSIITNASREGARSGILALYNTSGTQHGAQLATCSGSSDTSCVSVTDVVTNYCKTYLITFGSAVSPTITDNNISGSSLVSGQDLTVTVSYVYKFLLLPNFLSSFTRGINLSATTTMRME